MLKRIAPDQLRLGMYVQEIPGPWMNHPFWRGSFKLEKYEDLKTLRSAKIEQILIDTAVAEKHLASDASCATRALHCRPPHRRRWCWRQS